jgi:DNA-binding beta-propeller fold protein YncE
MTKGGTVKKLWAFGFLVLFSASWAFSSPWGIVLHRNGAFMSTVDFGYNPPKIYGPFMSGMTTHDVAVTPDNVYAVATSFYGQAVYVINIKDPTNPVLAGKISVSFSAEDVAISPNGKFAVVTDGGGSSSIIIINLANFSYSSYSLKSGYGDSVTIANDNETVILGDYSYSRLVYGKINSTFTGLVSERTISTPDYYPINSALSPDGKTLVVTPIGSGYVNIFEVKSNGDIALGANYRVRVADNPSSAAFSPDGTKAYVLSGGTPDRFSWIQVTGAGVASQGGVAVASLNTSHGWGAGFWGVDAIAVTGDGLNAIIGGPVSSGYNFAQTVRLSDFQVSKLSTNGDSPSGVATFLGAVLPPESASINRLTNNYIFYKEYINEVSWQAPSKALTPIAKYLIYRKSKGDADSSYQKVSEVTSSPLKYTDRGLKKSTYYTYRITVVDTYGRESSPVEIGN